MSTLSGGLNIVTNGLILSLDAANVKSYVSGSNVWSDISRNGITGTLISGSSYDASNGGAITFNGTNSYVLLPQATPNQTYGNYSFGIWFNFTTTHTSASTSNYMLMEAQNTLLGGVDNYLYKLSNASAPGTNGRIGFQTFNPLSTIYTTTNTWTGGRWYNIVCTYDITTSKQSIYVNGTFESSASIANCYFNTNTYFGLGAYTTPPRTWFLDGKISNFTVYNKTLSATEVSQNYNTIKTRFGL